MGLKSSRFKVWGVLMLVFLPALALASEGGEHGGGSIFDLIPYWINFILFVAGLWYLLKEPAVQFWGKRRNTAQSAVVKAEKELRIAEEKLAEARRNFDRVEEEANSVRMIIQREALAEKEALIAEAHQRAELIVEKARQTIASEKSAAENQLRRELAERVIIRAHERLREGLTREADSARRQSALDVFKQMLH